MRSLPAEAQACAASQEQQQQQQQTEALGSLQLSEGSGGSGAQAASLQMPPPSHPSEAMPGAAAVQGAPPAATPTITIVSGNQLRVQPATWTSGGSSGSGGGGQMAGRQSPSITEAGSFAGADGVAPSLPPSQMPPTAAATSPFQAPGAGFGEDPVAEGQLQRRPSYGTQVRSLLFGLRAHVPAVCKHWLHRSAFCTRNLCYYPLDLSYTALFGNVLDCEAV